MKHTKGNGKPIFILTCFTTLLSFIGWGQYSQAQWRSPTPINSSSWSSAQKSHQTFGFPSQNKMGESTVEVFRRAIINSALEQEIPPSLSSYGEKQGGKKDEEEELNFPPFPRVWTERTYEDSKSYGASASINLAIPFIGYTSGLRINKQFKYTVKTTFALIASDPSDTKNQDSGARVRSLNEGDDDKILYFDTQTMHSYPNVSSGAQMVGLCTYEMSLSSDLLRQHEASFQGKLGGGQFSVGGGVSASHDIGHSEGAKTVRFSKFFKLDREHSIDYYLKIKCMDEFSRSKKKEVESHFSKLVLELLWHHNPNSTCKPPLGNPDESTPEGDRSCLNWHADTFDSVLRQKTVPRCEVQADGAHRCVLKNREHSSCPMYANRKNLKVGYTPYRTEENRSIVTAQDFQRPCDEKSGLVCEMENQPRGFLFGIPLWMGTARCVKK